MGFFFPAKIESEEEDEDDLFSGKKEKPESDDDEEEESEEEPQQPKKVMLIKCKYSTYRTQIFKFILYLSIILYLFTHGFHSMYWDTLWNHQPSQVTFFLQPKGGLDFAAELAAKIGAIPVRKQEAENHIEDDDSKAGDDEWSDGEHQAPQIAEVQEKQLSKTKKSHSDSVTKDEKSHRHHRHHKKDRADSHSEHKHSKRRSSKTNVDTGQSLPAEDGENTV